jgi:multimeric flavodoxin WrbA
MKKFLAIMGSPHKGETYKAVKRFEEELKKLGEAEVEIVMLSEVGFRDCLGCHNCFMKGEETCREADKVQTLLKKMLEADMVLLCSPVYNQAMTSLMKKFLDYFTYLWHRPGMFGVRFMGISSGGGVFKGVFKGMKENVQSWGGVWAGELGVPHYEALTPKYKAKLDRDFTKKAGMAMEAAGRKDLPTPSLYSLISYRIWKMNANMGFSARDNAHWREKGWLDKKTKYYYDSKINPAKSAMVSAVGGIMQKIMRGIYVGY